MRGAVGRRGRGDDERGELLGLLRERGARYWIENTPDALKPAADQQKDIAKKADEVKDLPLPDKPMTARAADARVGYFTTHADDFSNDLARTPRQRIALQRHLSKLRRARDEEGEGREQRERATRHGK